MKNYVTDSFGVELQYALTPSSQPHLIATEKTLRWDGVDDPVFKTLRNAARNQGGKWQWQSYEWLFQTADACARMRAHAVELGLSTIYASRDELVAADDQAAKDAAACAPAIHVLAIRRGQWMLTQSPATREARRLFISKGSHAKVIVVKGVPRLVNIMNFGEAKRIIQKARQDGRKVIIDGRVMADKRGRVHLQSSGWIVRITVPVESSPWAAMLCPATSKTVGRWPNKEEVYAKSEIKNGCVDVEIPCTEWPDFKQRILALGFAMDGAEPDNSIPDPDAHAKNFACVPVGWNGPAHNGHHLFPYQKQGVAFAASRQYRCLISDEMGVGKTAQAIAAVQAAGAQRILVVVPVNARYVWDREIKGWAGPEAKIQHLRSSEGQISLGPDGWLIVGYDQLVSRKETWTCADDMEQKLVQAWLKASKLLPKVAETISTKTARKIVIPGAACTANGAPALNEKRLLLWNRLIERLRGRVLAAIEAWAPDMLLVDEAHRAKNSDAKRTLALRRLSPSAKGVILLTGTPVRNNAAEAVALMHLIDPAASAYLDKHFDKERVKHVLQAIQIRRLKKDVLPDLPPQIRTSIPVTVEIPDGYREALDYANECYRNALADDKSEREARHEMLAGIAKARRLLGKAKAPAAFEFVTQVLEEDETGCCVVFCGHHDTSDALAQLLRQAGKHAGIIDGRVTPAVRAALVDQFQSGDLDVLICGVQAASEAITLHRADTVVFVELDWVPGAIQQAEARIHRAGQKASTCWTYYLAADEDCLPAAENLDVLMWEALESKLAAINSLLDETAALVDSDTSDQALGTVGVQATVLGKLVRNFERRPSHEAGVEPVLVSRSEIDDLISDLNNFVDDLDLDAPAQSTQTTKDDVSNGEPAIKRAGRKAVLTPEERLARIRESKKRWKKANPEKSTAESRKLGAERVKRHREKRGDDYRAAHAEYVRLWRARKAGAPKTT